MALGNSEMEGIVDDWLDSNSISKECIECEGGSFERQSWKIMSLPRPQKPGNIIKAEDFELVFVMTCSKCGFIKMFSAEAIGL